MRQKTFQGTSWYPLLSINFLLFRYRKFSETQNRRVPLRNFSDLNNIVYCQYNSNLWELSRFVPSPSSATSVSDNIPARSFASLSHRIVRFQLTSPLAYIIARLHLACFFFTVQMHESCVHKIPQPLSYITGCASLRFARGKSWKYTIMWN